MEKTKSSLLSSSMFQVRQMVLRVGFKFKLTMARVRTPAPSRLLLALLAGYGVQAMALPTGGQVASGNVSIGAPANGSLNVTQTTDKGIINWQSFNVASGEKVNFLQPSSTSSTLNRVIGSDPSGIFGQINATGQVFLVNNAGIYFAPGAQVNAAGLVASTLQLADADYLAGNYVFAGTGGAVDNQGVIKAGFVALAGAQVSNTGTIVADGGTAALVAGSRVTMNLTGSDLVSVSVDAPTAAALVRSGGIVQADGGQVLISAKATDALLGTVVNVDGIVQAHSIGSRNGVITLDGGSSGVVQVTGTLDASGKGAGQTGGTVKVTGANVGLFDATVDVSGDAGGGVVRVGGDWHGAGADGDKNASQTVFAGGVINANAITSGNGGNVVLWSDDRTQVTGAITARGGSAGGNGGALETSSHDELQAGGSVDLGAAHGTGGTWLIDPRDLTISTAAQNNINTGTNTFTSNGAASVLNNTTLSGALASGITVNVNTGTSGSANGDITVTAPITAPNLTSGQTSTLNLNAQGNITFTGGSITASVANTSLNVNLNAGTTGAGPGGAGTNPGAISMDAASAIDTGVSGTLAATGQGLITLAALTVGGTTTLASNGFAISQTAAWTLGDTLSANAGGSSVTLTNASNSIGKLTVPTVIGSAGAVDVSTTVAIALGLINATTLHVAAQGNVTQTGVIHTTTSASIDDTTTDATINLATQNNNLTQLAATTTGTAATVTVTNPNDLVLGTIATHGLTVTTSGGSSGVVTQAAGTQITVPGAVKVTANTTDDVTVGSATSSLGSFGATGAAVSVTVGASIALDDVTATSLTTATGSAGGVTQTATKSITATTTSFGAGSLGVDIENTGNAIGTWGATAAGGPVTFTSTGAVQLGAVSGSALTVTAGGNVTQTGALVITNAANVQAAGNDITLNGANSFGSFGGHGGAVSVTANKTAGTGLVLDDITATSLTTATGSSGGVTQTATKSITATTTSFGAGSLGVDIENTGNAIGTWGATSTGGPVTFTSAGAIALGAVSAKVLNVTAGGTISQSAGVLNVTTTSDLQAGSTHDITLTSGNDFGGAVTANGQAVSLTDTGALTVHLTAGTTATLNAGGVLTVDGTTASDLIATGVGLVFGSGATQVGGVLDAQSGAGTISQTGQLKVLGAGTTTLNAGSTHALTLSDATNVFTGPVNATGSSVDVRDAGSLDVTATIAAGGSLTLAATAGALTMPGGAISTTGDVSLTSGTGLTIANAISAGNVTLGGGAISIQNVVTATNAFNATSSSTISEAGAGAIVAGAAATINAGTHDVTLNGNNDFSSVSLTGGAVSLNDINALTAHLTSTAGASVTAGGALTVDGTVTGGALVLAGNGIVFGSSSANPTSVTGNLTANAGTGSITQNGTLAVTGTSGLTAAGNPITLNNPVNNFGGLVTVNGGTVAISDGGALSVHLGTVGNAQLTATGALAVDGATATGLTVTGNGVSFGATNVGGALDASTTGTGTIAQTGILAVTGATTLNAGSRAITLSMPANDFGGPVAATGGAVSLADVNALTAHVTAASATLTAGGLLSVDGSTTGALDATGVGIAFGPAGTTVHGALTATSTGAVTQSGDLLVSGAATIAAAGQSVTLARQTNALSGGVTVAAATVDIEQAGALTAHLNNVGSATVKSGAGLTIDGASSGGVIAQGAAVGFGAGGTSIGGTLAATSTAGGITQAGALAVTGASTLVAGTGNVTLATASNALTGAVTVSGNTVTLADASPLTSHVTANGSATLSSAGALILDGSAGALTATGTSIGQSGALSVTGLSNFNAGSGDILLDSPGTNLQGAITATGHAIRLTDSHAIAATLTAGGDVVLNSTGDVSAQGSFGGGLKVTGAAVSLDSGTSAQPLGVGGLLDVTSSGDTSLGYVSSAGANVAAGGAVLLGGTLASSGNISLKGSQVQGVNRLGALSVGAASTVSLDTSGTGGGNIGKGGATAAGAIDDQAIIGLLGSTGQGGLFINFNSGLSAWFRVSSQVQTHQINPHQLDSQRAQTFFCDTQTCVNVLGQTTVIADTVVSNILSAAAQDAADAAFGTENLDFAIRKGYVTTIGRVPPGIDEIAGDLGATQCDSRVTSPTAIAADRACSAGGKAAK